MRNRRCSVDRQGPRLQRTNVPRIDVVIPILDEEDTLSTQICRAANYLEQNFRGVYDVRLIIADNGSTDHSPEIGGDLESNIEIVEYLRIGERGVGRALKFAWTRSDADIVGYMDLDLATDLKHLQEAFAPLIARKVDVVTGSRLRKGAKVVGRSLVRAVTTRAFNLIVRSYFRTNFSDGMCGFKFLRREHISQLMKLGAQSDGWFFATELLICAEYAGLRVKDLPVVWRDDPNSRVEIGKLAGEYIGAMRELKAHLKATTREPFE